MVHIGHTLAYDAGFLFGQREKELIMGLFSGIKNAYRKGEAVAVVQNALERLRKGGLFVSIPGVIDTPKMAKMLVETAWNYNPDLFSGASGERPHKLSVAAYALAAGVDRLEAENPLRPILSIALNNIMKELQKGDWLDSLSDVDNFLLEEALGVFQAVVEQLENDPLTKDVEGGSRL